MQFFRNFNLSISKVFAFTFVSADNNHSQRAQMPKQVSKKGNFSAKIWKFLHTLENLTNAICICRQIGKLASICILFVFVRVLGPIYLYSICICQACAFGLFGPICHSASKSICLWRWRLPNKESGSYTVGLRFFFSSLNG